MHIGVKLEKSHFTSLEPLMPSLLTPGDAGGQGLSPCSCGRAAPIEAVRASLTDYQNPTPLETLEQQMRLAIAEGSDLEFVPDFPISHKKRLSQPGAGQKETAPALLCCAGAECCG